MAVDDEFCGVGDAGGGLKTRSVRPLRTLTYVFCVCDRLPYWSDPDGKEG